MRINQYIAHNSTYSRREADRLIEQGRVRINKAQANAGQHVKPQDRITIDSKPLKPSKRFSVIAYHKPKGEIVSKHDTHNRRVVFDSLPSGFAHFRTIGRLDFASEGLLLLTDSAKVADALTHSNLTRSYYLKLCGKLTPAVFDAMEQGLHLDDAHKGAHEKSKIVSMDFAPFVSYKVLGESKNYARMR
ncbi:MAG: rRNA pseudouridine synthase, partial [Helicobacter sp.]|nr:rRNA pseudouridine synthase [Helicobacter sp.]